MKRVFTAINLPNNLKQKLAQKQSEIKALFPVEARDVAFKWVEPQNFHITWEFLGDTKESAMPRLFENLKKETASLKPFGVALSKVCFDNKQNPRLIWIKAKGANKQFHITLARVKQWGFKQMEAEEIPDIDIALNEVFEVLSIELMESQLSRQGPKYFFLQKFPLA